MIEQTWFVLHERCEETVNNTVSIVGDLVGVPIDSHEICEEKFYIVQVSVPRKSGNVDILNVTIPGRLASPELWNGGRVSVKGQMRSYNKKSEDGMHLELSVFAKEIRILNDDDSVPFENSVTIEGFVCKPVTHRTTPLGRKISNIIVAIDANRIKSYYIPVISWGKESIKSSSLEVGDNVRVVGRFQSRKYLKTIGDNKAEERVAYELSAKSVTKIGQNNKSTKEEEVQNA